MSEVPPRNALNLWKNGAVALAIEGADGQARMLGENHPLPVAFPPGATSDPDSAREATLLQVLSALQVLSGNTDGLEAFAQQSNTLLTQLTSYNDGVETLLGSIGTNTDGIEGLLSALGVKDDNVLSKLETLRVLLAGTLAVSAASLPLPTGASTEATLAAQKAVIDLMKTRLDLLATDAKSEQIRALLAGTLAISAAALPLPAGASTSALQTTGNTSLASILTALQGTLQTKANPDNATYLVGSVATGTSADAIQNIGGRAITAIDIGAGWTAADISFEHTSDGGTTWVPMYDIYGNPLSYKAGASRSIAIPPGDLMRRGHIRLRSGVPGAYVNQTSTVGIVYTVVTL